MKTSTNDETTCTAGDKDSSSNTNSSSSSSASTTTSFGILKRSSDDKISKKKHSASSGKKSAKIVWDEQNLAENEQIQQAIIEHCKKTNKRIDEPKTPYVSYVLPDDEEVAGNENSENGAKSHTTTMSPVHTDDHDVSWMEDVEASEAHKVLPREVDSKIISPTEQMSRLQLAFAASNTTNESGHDEARPRRLIDDWESPSSPEPEPEPEMITVGMDEVSSNQNESEEFARKRKQHYNEFLMVKQMRERMKASLDDEDEGEE